MTGLAFTCAYSLISTELAFNYGSFSLSTFVIRVLMDSFRTYTFKSKFTFSGGRVRSEMDKDGLVASIFLISRAINNFERSDIAILSKVIFAKRYCKWQLNFLLNFYLFSVSYVVDLIVVSL